MSSDLFGGEDLIPVTLYYMVEKNKAGYSQVSILTDERAKKMLADETDKAKVKVLNTKWRPQTWKASNDLLKASTTYNYALRQNDIDWTMYRDARLKACLIEWDAKDGSGNPVEVTPESINKLQSTVALALLEKYDKTISMDQDSLAGN